MYQPIAQQLELDDKPVAEVSTTHAQPESKMLLAQL